MMAAARSEKHKKEDGFTLALEGDTDIVVTRTFDAPARFVYDAWTKPELVKRWWSPEKRATWVSCDGDVRVGGKYRYVLDPRGDHPRFAFSGEYKELVPYTRVVHTEAFEPEAQGPLAGFTVVTVTFDERNGRTFVTQRTKCPSSEVRDMIVSSGMEAGAKEAIDQLAALVKELAAA